MASKIKSLIKKTFSFLPDKPYLSLLFRIKFKRKLNWNDPKTFNEKLQWLKLYDRKPEYTTMVDKYEAKRYVAGIIGEEYVIPTLGVWDSADDIDFDALPNQFVLKCTHDSGGLVICKDKSSLDIPKAIKKLNRSLRRNFYRDGREWPYKNVKPRIIAEKYMEDIKTGELRDYKFFCFNGEVKLLFIATERGSEDSETKFDFYDMNFNHLDIRNGHPNSTENIDKPINFEKMKKLSAMLSKGIPHVRIDFYEVNGEVKFGEMTFFHWSGFIPFEPEEWDIKLGSWLELP